MRGLYMCGGMINSWFLRWDCAREISTMNIPKGKKSIRESSQSLPCRFYSHIFKFCPIDDEWSMNDRKHKKPFSFFTENIIISLRNVKGSGIRTTIVWKLWRQSDLVESSYIRLQDNNRTLSHTMIVCIKIRKRWV